MLTLITLMVCGAPPLRGKVIDQFDRPRAVSVCASGAGCVDADLNGRFSFARTESSTLLLRAIDDRSEVVEVGPEVNDVVLRVHAFPRLSGKVVDDAGASPAGLRVDDQHVTSRFDIAFEKMPARVEISARGFATTVVTTPEPDAYGDVKLGRVVLTRGRTVQLIVTDQSTAKPITTTRIALPATAARVASTNRHWSCGNALMEWLDQQLPLRTSPDGAYTFQLSADQLELEVLSEDYRSRSIAIPPGTTVVHVTLERR